VRNFDPGSHKIAIQNLDVSDQQNFELNPSSVTSRYNQIDR
jgi:hypothetical protein